MKMSLITRLLLAASLLVFTQFSAQAHTGLKLATPADGAVVNAPPAKIDLVFTESVRLVKLELLGTGHEMPTNFAPNSEARAEFSFETPGMHPGTFTVNWAVIGADGHTIANSYSFTVDPAAPANSAGP